eukprot:CAMPEP_0202371822 /NCGR_PEP_ID=MMETSP1127-20130417/3156_1 /ASSEMBLY_ACC=CAM_ASM_000462 /TAXON_ID=3047 /ORGANISM="Dunaliella tertiolecta, Strain CCMP1320" /LENGTH=663 /DNA_ID=CAMNT_0048968193 /DNA_START=36 /DNA_END=2027 /DNA_ORIENTATION=+
MTRRQHGCQFPLDPYQISALAFFAGIVACCYGLQMPVIQDYGTKVALLVIYTVLVALAVALNLTCSLIDPSDSGLQGNTDSGDYYCSLCQASVGRTSKHCKACDRCVEGFDHHCKWLNNCVGKRNYKYFIVLVSGTMAACVCQFAWALWLVVRSFKEKEKMKPELVNSYGGNVNYIGWQFFLVLYLVLLAAALVMVGELFSFHVVLISKGMTTYDYIITQREKQAFEEGGESRLSESLSTAKGVLKCMCCCKPSQVHDEGQAAARVSRRKVGLNPCAAMKASKPEGSPFTYGAHKQKKAPPPADADLEATLETNGLESNSGYPANVHVWAKAALENGSMSNTPARTPGAGSPVSEQCVHGGILAPPGGVQTRPPVPATMGSSPQQQQQQQQQFPATTQQWQPQLRQHQPEGPTQQVTGMPGPYYNQQQPQQQQPQPQLGSLQQAIPLTQQQLQQKEQQLQHLLQQQQRQHQQHPMQPQAPSHTSTPSKGLQHPVAPYNNPYLTNLPEYPPQPPVPFSAHGSLPTSPSQQRAQSMRYAEHVPYPPPGHTLPPLHHASSRNATGKRALSPIPTALLSSSSAAAPDAANSSDQGEVPAQDAWQGHGTASSNGGVQERGMGVAGYPQQGNLASAQPAGAWSLMYPSYHVPDKYPSYHPDPEMSSEVT